MRNAMLALAIALIFSSLATTVVVADGFIGTAVTVGADVVGVKTDMQLGAMNLRLWLSHCEFGSSETGAPVNNALRMRFWQPRDCNVGYRYLVGAIDVNGVDFRRLKDAKVWLKTDRGPIELPVREFGPERMFCIDLSSLPLGLYAIDLASYNNARKISAKIPFGSIGINRETQRVNGYVQFTVFDPSTVLDDYFTDVTETNGDPQLRARIEEQYLLTKFSYAVEPSRPDLDHETLVNRYNQKVERQSALDAAGQSSTANTITYTMTFMCSDGRGYNGPIVVTGDDDGGSYPAFNATGPFIKMGGGATAGTKGFAFEFPGTGVSIPRQTYSVQNGTVISVTVPSGRR